MIKHFKFRSINVDDVPLMTELLISRQNLESEVFPFLKNSCLNVKYITEKFGELFTNSEIIGMGAFVDDELVGYIIGVIETVNRNCRYASVPYEGVAIRRNQTSELLKYLYSNVAVLWLEQGCFNHSILVPIGSKVYYEAFLQLSFAIEQVHAVMNIEEYKPFENVADVEIRLANKMDSEAMGRMSSIIGEFHNSAPVFIPIVPEVLARRKEGFKRLVEESDDIVLIAEKHHQELGFQDYEIIIPNLMTPDDAIELCVAGTYFSQMGRGIGKKMMNEGYKIIKENGYGNIITDWRITNLVSSSFWPKCGFKPLAYRMARYIDKDFIFRL